MNTLPTLIYFAEIQSAIDIDKCVISLYPLIILLCPKSS